MLFSYINQNQNEARVKNILVHDVMIHLMAISLNKPSVNPITNSNKG